MRQAIWILLFVLFSGRAGFAQYRYMVFPQFINGGSSVAGLGMASDLTIINQGNSDMTVYIELYNDDGSRTKDLLDGTFFTIPPLGMKMIGMGTNGPVRTGWMFVDIGPITVGPPTIGSLKLTAPGLGSSAVQSSEVGQTFMLPVRHYASMNTGIAIANVCPYANDVSVTLRGADGIMWGQYNVHLPANGHVAKFIDEMIPVANPKFYIGSATVALKPTTLNNCGGSLAVTAFELGSTPGSLVLLPVGKLN